MKLKSLHAQTHLEQILNNRISNTVDAKISDLAFKNIERVISEKTVIEHMSDYVTCYVLDKEIQKSLDQEVLDRIKKLSYK